MSLKLKDMRAKSKKRKMLMAQAYGVKGVQGFSAALMSEDDRLEINTKKRQSFPPTAVSLMSKSTSSLSERLKDTDADKKTSTDNDDSVIDDTEFVSTDSSAFLKGLQSANPHNDYNQNFVGSGLRPQNFIRDVGLAKRFEEYPKLRDLIKQKDDLVSNTNTPPMYLQCDLESFDLHQLNCQFDVILIEPPLEEFHKTSGIVYDKYWTWDEIEKLEINVVAANRSFIWVWCGGYEGLERGRMCLKKWGFRRCEDICWIKTNIKGHGQKIITPNGIFQRTKEHCLMGIKGTVKRSTDGDFIHANVDIDLIIEEEPEYGCKDKPIEIFHIIEHFCLGRRRLHLFGRDNTIRPGWLTLGPELTSSNFDANIYSSTFSKTDTSYLTGCTDEIERLRPKSPTPNSQSDRNQGSRGSNRNRDLSIRPAGDDGRYQHRIFSPQIFRGPPRGMNVSGHRS